MSLIPQNFDWVSARSSCTANQVFNELCLGIESDIRKNNEAMQASERDQVSSTLTEGGCAIAISRAKRTPSERVFVGVSGNRIEVYDDAMKVVIRLQSRSTMKGAVFFGYSQTVQTLNNGNFDGRS